MKYTTHNPGSGLDKDQHFSSTMMEYEPTIPSRYMLGSSLGTVLCCSRKVKENGDVALNRYRAHHGPIRALQRNPLFPKNFLTAGDRSIKVWSEDISVSPLQWIYSGQHKVTSALWSPVRPSVMFATRDDGFLMVEITLIVYPY